MDLFVQSYTTQDQEPILDFEITGKGELTVISNEAEIKQRAIVSAFTQKGTIPQMPDTGVDWTGLVLGEVSPAEINSQVMQQIHECADTYSYLPKYSSINDQLIVTIEQQGA